MLFFVYLGDFWFFCWFLIINVVFSFWCIDLCEKRLIFCEFWLIVWFVEFFFINKVEIKFFCFDNLVVYCCDICCEVVSILEVMCDWLYVWWEFKFIVVMWLYVMCVGCCLIYFCEEGWMIWSVNWGCCVNVLKMNFSFCELIYIGSLYVYIIVVIKVVWVVF